jgi:hypothetical protein
MKWLMAVVVLSALAVVAIPGWPSEPATQPEKRGQGRRCDSDTGLDMDSFEAIIERAFSAGDSSKRVSRLIEQLGDADFHVRQQATAELARMGPAALRALKEAARSQDPEVRSRARALLERIRRRDRPRYTILDLVSRLHWATAPLVSAAR